MTVYKLEIKESFHKKIEEYYLELAENNIPINLLNGFIDKITDIQYDNYKRFWNQYPKSRKRYSELKISDLEHPFTQYMIIDFFKSNTLLKYQEYSKIMLRMNDAEFRDFKVR